jgi:hypothetical protein
MNVLDENVIQNPPTIGHSSIWSHHADGLVNPKVREPANGYHFWIPQSM